MSPRSICILLALAIPWHADLVLGDEVVTNTDDPGAGSLRQALQDAAPGSKITFDSSLSGKTILLRTGQLLIEKSLVIDASSLTEGLTIDGGSRNRVFEIRSKKDVNLPAKVLWVTSYLDEASAPDKGFTDLLKGAGYEVTRWLSRNDPTASDVVALNAADLIILSRSVNSEHFKQEQEDRLWNTKITTPLLCMSGYTMNTDGLGLTRERRMTDSKGPVALRRLVEEHPIFDGIEWENGNGSERLEPYAMSLAGERGISFNVDRPDQGSILAAVANEESGVQAAPGIIEYAAGSVINITQILAGHRLIFLAGSREADGAAASTAGRYDLTAHGEQLFLNCVTHMADRAHVTLQGLTITGGSSLTVPRGGGILNRGADLTLNKVTVDGNAATKEGGGIYNIGVLRVSRSSIRNNHAPAGAGIANALSLTLEDTEVTTNGSSKTLGGGIKTALTSFLRVKRSTFFNNTASRGGAIYSEGTTDLENATLNRNVAEEAGGGIFNAGADIYTGAHFYAGEDNEIIEGGYVNLRHCTVAGNTAGTRGGGGAAMTAKTEFSIKNCIFAGNAITGTTALGPDILNRYEGGTEPSIDQGGYPFGDVWSWGANVMTDVSDSGYWAGLMIVDDPLLHNLADNGGPTRTMALRDRSPAIDAGIIPEFFSIQTDQRGVFRPSGGLPDLGALEMGGATGFAGWASAKIPNDLDQTFNGDADGDGLGNGSEFALGRDPLSNGSYFEREALVDPAIAMEALPDGSRQLSFGFAALAKSDTTWVLRRSVNLIDYTEIYRHVGPTGIETIGTDVSAQQVADQMVVTDRSAPTEPVFYQFVAESME